MIKQIMSSLAATLLLVGCAHQNHGDHDNKGLASTVVKYPFKMAEYVIWSPFHPIESTRKAIEATAEVPVRVLDATSEPLWFNSSYCQAVTRLLVRWVVNGRRVCLADWGHQPFTELAHTHTEIVK